MRLYFAMTITAKTDSDYYLVGQAIAPVKVKEKGVDLDIESYHKQLFCNIMDGFDLDDYPNLINLCVTMMVTNLSQKRDTFMESIRASEYTVTSVTVIKRELIKEVLSNEEE